VSNVLAPSCFLTTWYLNRVHPVLGRRKRKTQDLSPTYCEMKKKASRDLGGKDL